MYYVYVLYSCEQDKFYIGFTEDLRNRVKEHLRGEGTASRRLKNPSLVYYEACKAKGDATKRERQLKTGYGRAYLRNRLKDSISAT